MNNLKIFNKNFAKSNYTYPELYLGNLAEKDKGIKIGITPPNSENCYKISIVLEKEITGHENKLLFFATCIGNFTIKYNKNRPSKTQLFNLILDTSKELNNYISTLPDNHYNHKKFSLPIFDKIENDLSIAINQWNIHYNTPFKRVQHRFEFQNFPIIPEAKRFSEEKILTYEQEILQKIQANINLSKIEQQILNELNIFYTNFKKSLSGFNFNNLNHRNRKELKEYINSVFNFIPLIVSEEEVKTFYRVIKNKNLNIQRVTNKSQLVNPPLKIVRKYKIHNRANTDSSTVMYCSSDLKATFLEIKDTSDRITLGIWRQNKNLKTYTIPYLVDSNSENINSSNATAYIEEMENIALKSILKTFYQCIANEFTKNIGENDSKYNYLISGWFSEKFLESKPEQNGTDVFDFDCIMYPSVENNLKSTNIALKPNKIEKFDLVEVIEFKNLDLNKIKVLSDEEILKLGQYAYNIEKDGKIIW